jgi:hypothetical protein
MPRPPHSPDDAPPPVPGPAETRAALRLLAAACAVGLALWLGWATALVGPDSPLLRWGRSGSTAWVLHRADALAADPALRAHPGGQIVWAVGSSITREAFDEDAVNAALEGQGSPYRLRKLGQNRGAAALTAPVLARLPVQPGDLVIHNVALENFRADWISWTRLPMTTAGQLLSPGALWAVDDRPLPHKLEQAAAQPPAFWAWHDEVMGGLSAWGLGLFFYFQAPKPAKAGDLLRFHTHLRGRRMVPDQLEAERARYALTAADLDLSPGQLHQAGIAQLRAHCAENGAQLMLLDIPTSAWDQWAWQDASARAAWDRLRDGWPELVVAPQLPGDHFYDRRHPNRLGRAVLSDWLVDLLAHPGPGDRRRPPQSEAVPFPWAEAADDLAADVEEG